MVTINKRILAAAAGTTFCFCSWLLTSTGGDSGLLWFVFALFSPWILAFYSEWKANQFPKGSSSFFLAGSLAGVFVEALREINGYADPVLIDDNDGLYLLVFPFIIFWWLVAKTIGNLLYRKNAKKKGQKLPPMPKMRKVMVGTIIFLGIYFFISFVISTIKGSD
jgi:hypothetical protein